LDQQLNQDDEESEVCIARGLLLRVLSFETLDSYGCARTDSLVWFGPDLRHHLHPVDYSCLISWGKKGRKEKKRKRKGARILEARLNCFGIAIPR